MTHLQSQSRALAVGCAAALLFSTTSAQSNQSATDISLDEGDAVFWNPQVAYDRMVLTVAGPGDYRKTQEFSSGNAPAFDLLQADGQSLPDGGYTFQLETVPYIEPWVRDAMSEAREKGEEATLLPSLRAAGALPEAPPIQTGHFHILDGQLVQGHVVEGETEGEASARGGGGTVPGISGSVTQPVGGNQVLEFLIADDLYVLGSACVGIDCVNNSAFGFDTLKLVENNLRILFQDTSNSASFPSNDWRILINDTTNGGANKFSIEDTTGGRVPFTLRAGAPSNSLYVDAQGDLGLGTATPALEFHIADGDTPSMRLEQNTTGGFNAQTWDIAGNETNFFVRDVTGGSRLPFRIRPGALTSSIDIASSGRVGVGTASPQTALHVFGAGTRSGLKVQDVSAGSAPRLMVQLENNGAVGISMTDTSAPALANPTWNIGTVRYPNPVTSLVGSFQVALGLSGRLTLEENGDLTVTGTVTGLSDKDAKESFEAVDTRDVLERVAALDISTWEFKEDAKESRHMGPMAQDFRAQFGLGADERHISYVDTDGVALAAIQGLYELTQEKDEVIEDLEARLALLESRLASVLATMETVTVSEQR